jgi:hypothetical protein
VRVRVPQMRSSDMERWPFRLLCTFRSRRLLKTAPGMAGGMGVSLERLDGPLDAMPYLAGVL